MQVVHSYGEKPNEDFLQYYGFVDIENVNDAYTANLMQWVKQHFHAETGRVQAVEKSKAATKVLKQVAATLLYCLCSTHYRCLLDFQHLTLVSEFSLVIHLHAITHMETLNPMIDVHTSLDGWHEQIAKQASNQCHTWP